MKTTSMLRLASRYLAHRRFATTISILAIAISLTFVVAVGVVNFAVKKTAVEGSIRYPLIVGPAGASGVQLILSTIFHIDKPSGTIPFSVYEELKEDQRVISAYPVAVADTYMNIRIIGVNQDFLEDIGVGASAGTLDLSNIENAVFGAAAASRTDVRIGDTFHGQHGMVGSMGAHEHTELTYKVAGILNPTGGPEDTAIFTNYKSVWHIHEKHSHAHAHNAGEHHDTKDEKAPAEIKQHEHHAELHQDGHAEQHTEQHAEHQDTDDHHHNMQQATPEEPVIEAHEAEHAHEAKHEHEAAKGHHHHHDKYSLSTNMLTAVLVRTSNPAYTGMLEREYTLRDGTLAVDTGKSIREFVNHINKGEIFVEMVSVGMLAIALVMILVTLVMSLNERRKELALLRMLGVGRFTLALTVMIEALVLTLLGSLAGLFSGHILAYVCQEMIRQSVGVAIEPFTVTGMEVMSLWVALVAGQLLALIAMLFTYRMNVVEQIARD